MKRIILHIHTFCLLTLLCPAGLAAQSVIRGIVIDRESQLPVEAATVQLTRGNVSLPINYTLSNNEGTFTLTQPKRTDSLLVSVSLLGYQTQQQAVHAGQTLRFEMEPQVFSLKEVETVRDVSGGSKIRSIMMSPAFSPQRINPSRTYYGNFRVSISMIWGRSLTTGKRSVISMWRDWISPTGNTSKSARTCEPHAVQNIQVMENHHRSVCYRERSRPKT